MKSNGACPFPPGSKVVSYARDSGGDEQERSVERQNHVYADYCATHGLILLHAFADRARPGSSTAGRDDFERMIAYLRKNPDGVAGVILWKHNRFARNQLDSQYFKADLRRRGFILVFMADDIPDAGDLTPVFESLLEWKAERDLKDISTDAKGGLADLVKSIKPDGGFEGFAPGRPPRCFKRQTVQIGLKRNGQPRIVSRWVPDPELWERGRLAWKMRAEGASLAAVHAATRLYSVEGSYVTFFANEIYRGVFVFGGERLENFVPALCTAEQWNAVQAIRQENREMRIPTRHPRRVGSRYILGGLIECAQCRRPMRGVTSGRNRWRAYTCLGCGLKVGAVGAEAGVVELLANRILTPASLQQLYDAWQSGQAQAALRRNETLAELRGRLGALKRAIANLVDSLERAPVSRAIAERLAERERERTELETQIAKAESGEREAASHVLTAEQLAAFGERLRAELLSGDPARAKPVLQAFIVRIEAEKERGRVFYTLPRSFGGPNTPMDCAPTGSLPFRATIDWRSPRRACPDPDRNARIVAERRAGATLRELAASYGLTTARIDQLCQPHVPRRFPGRRSGR